MKVISIVLCLAITYGFGLFGCNSMPKNQEEHIDPVLKTFTGFTEDTELFVEFNPLIVGEPTVFTVYLSSINSIIQPIKKASITVSLIVGETGIRNSTEITDSSGICTTSLKPGSSGSGMLVFDIQQGGKQSQFKMLNVEVYAEKSALPPAKTNPMELTVSKEMSWNAGLMVSPVQKADFWKIIQVNGQLIPAPNSESVVVSKSGGIIKFSSRMNQVGEPVRLNQSLFTVSGGSLIHEENIDLSIQQAKLEETTAKAEYERLKNLLTHQLVTQEMYQQALLRYESSRIKRKSLVENYSSSGKTVFSPSSGIISQLYVREGQHVEAGEPVVLINKRSRILLRADVPATQIQFLGQVQGANFTVPQHNEVYNTLALNGRKVPLSNKVESFSRFIPLFFEIDCPPNVVQGQFTSVFLKSAKVPDVIAIPKQAILEEQGTYYVYIQTGGETYEKRIITTGGTDSQLTEVLDGLEPGERIVTRGAYQIKLAVLNQSIPDHGHAH